MTLLPWVFTLCLVMAALASSNLVSFTYHTVGTRRHLESQEQREKEARTFWLDRYKEDCSSSEKQRSAKAEPRLDPEPATQPLLEHTPDCGKLNLALLNQEEAFKLLHTLLTLTYADSEAFASLASSQSKSPSELISELSSALREAATSETPESLTALRLKDPALHRTLCYLLSGQGLPFALTEAITLTPEPSPIYFPRAHPLLLQAAGLPPSLLTALATAKAIDSEKEYTLKKDDVLTLFENHGHTFSKELFTFKRSKRQRKNPI